MLRWCLTLVGCMVTARQPDHHQYQPNYHPHQPAYPTQPPPYQAVPTPYPTHPPHYPTEPSYVPTEAPHYPTEPQYVSTKAPLYPTQPPRYEPSHRPEYEPQAHSGYEPTTPPYQGAPRPEDLYNPRYEERYPESYPASDKYDEPSYPSKYPVYETNEERPVSPSRSLSTGYVPREIVKFRETYKDLVQRFKGIPLLTSDELFAESAVFYNKDPQEDYYPEDNYYPGDNHYPEDDYYPRKESSRRGGRFVNWQGILSGLGIAPSAFGFAAGAFPFNFAGNQLGIGPNDEVNVGGSVNLFDTGRFLAGPKKQKAQMKGVEPCGNGDGTCEGSDKCFLDRGESIGKCMNCMKCSACCKYAYEDQAMSNKTISFFQSPGYPDTRRDSYSSSLTLEIRHDVEQVLIEFIDFEMPISPYGCTDIDFFEIISAHDPDGVLGPGNSRFCGLNTDQHLYLDVKGGDLLIFKAVTSGVGFVPLAVGPDGVDYYDEAGSFVDVDEPTRYDEYGKPYGHGDQKKPTKKPRKLPIWSSGDYSYRFQVKITQILHKAPYRYLSQKGSGKGGASGNTLKIGNDDYASGYIQLQSDIPDYYRKLAAPRGCKQYYKDQSGTVESFNFDSNSRMPNNLDYSICFRVPEKSCGLSLSALKFDIPAWNPECMSGEQATSGGFPCCTAGLQYEQDEYGAVSQYGQYGPEQRVEKFIGVDATSDGRTSGPNYRTNLLRYFFCGENMGKNNFIVSERKGPLRLQVYSDANTAKNYRGRGVGFRLKYEVDTGC